MLAAMSDRASHHLIDDLRTLLEVSNTLAATTELNPLLEQITAAAIRVLGCERTTVFLYDAARHELFSQLTTQSGDLRFDADKGIAGECVRTGRIINVPDAYADARFNPEIDKATGFRTRNLLTFPLRNHEGRIVGALQALNKSGGPFAARDEELAQTLSSLAGVAVQRQLLINEFAEKQRLERDLAVARNIQQSTLPKTVPQAAGYDIAGFNEPADATGGDAFDYCVMHDQRIALMIADATGHGVGPALIIAQYRAMMRALLSVGLDTVTVMNKINDLLCEDLPDGMFVTGFLGLLDPARGVIEYVSAGHGPLLHHRRRDDQRIERIASTVPLGVLRPLECGACDRIELAPGDTVLLLTDGFFECTNARDEQFGIARVFDVVTANPDCSAADLIARLHAAVLDFVGDTPQADDLTAVIIRRR